jgi:diguanylate cyclase (GGDEF)-like protein
MSNRAEQVVTHQARPAGRPDTRSSCAARLRRLARVDLSDAQAAELWRAVEGHRRKLRLALERDVGQRVALLDYVLNIDPQVVSPTIIEAAALESIERTAISDSLTGLHNRQYFDIALRREAESSDRREEATSLLLLDLDGFKAVNDGEGHWVGDRALEIVGHILRRHVRTGDVACRYGGDEFALLLAETPASQAMLVAERIRVDVEETFTRRPLFGRQLRLTASVGIATVPAGGAGNEPPIATADRALYDAKHKGGNCVATALDEGASGPARWTAA